jgi:hypothetical protein
MQAPGLFRIAVGMVAVLNLSAAAAHAQSAPTSGSRVPLYFEENLGQTAGEVRFLARAPGYTAYLTGGQTVLQYRTERPGRSNGKEAVVRLTLMGPNGPPTALEHPWGRASARHRQLSDRQRPLQVAHTHSNLFRGGLCRRLPRR